MNAEDAKLILQCRRPRGQDDHDPAISEALAFASCDVAFMEAMRREEALDVAIGERLRSVEPPADLRRKILIGARVTRVRPVWRRPGWLAAAACLVLSVPLAVKYWPAGPQAPVYAALTLPELRGLAVHKLSDGPQVAGVKSMEDVKSYLARRNASCCVSVVPKQLCHSPGGPIGCAVYEVKGREVTLICFNAGKLGEVHLFTVDASVLEDRPGGPIYETGGGWHTCTWPAGGHVLLLAGSAGSVTREDLEAMRK